MKVLATPALLLVTILLTAGGWSHAERVTTSGTTMYVTLEQETSDLPDGRKLQRGNTKGFSTSKLDEPPRTATCWSTAILDADGNYDSGTGYCQEVDVDGDSVFISLTFGRDAVLWAYVNGTGKFKGAKGGGTSRISTRWSDGSFLVTWEGSWELQ